MVRITWLGVLVLVALLAGCSAKPAPAGESIAHPDDPAKQVEYFVASPQGEGPWPAVVLLHGHQDGARPGGADFVRWGVLDSLARRGYLAVSVSQPGYGRSSGPADFCGPFTQRAVLAVIAHLRERGRIAPNQLVLQGISRGAIVAGLVAAQEPEVAGLVMISGVYDLPAYVALRDQGERAEVVRAISAETDGSAEALAARSVSRVADRIKAQTLILGGGRDERTDPAGPAELASAITRNGGRARAVVYPDSGHAIPLELRNRDIDPFIDAVLRGARQQPPGR